MRRNTGKQTCQNYRNMAQVTRKRCHYDKIDIISGFLGAGKTTFIKKLLKEAIAGEK